MAEERQSDGQEGENSEQALSVGNLGATTV